MKKYLLLLAAILMLHPSVFSQNNIRLNIHHKLNETGFNINTAAVNNMNHDFKVTRLQYYICQFTIKHNGGTETEINDLWVLADGIDGTTTIDLGNHDINEVEGIAFHIGVDQEHNHLDPASFQEDHPLAPKHPSMHWGWNAGYRFLAFEGMGGANYNQGIELHGLGDDNFFEIVLDLNAIPSANVINIEVDADYTRTVEDISVSSGVLVHGDYGAAKKALENFRDYVFSTALTTATPDFSEVENFDIFPNPAYHGSATFKISSTNNQTYEVFISDITGRAVQRFESVESNESVELKLGTSGLFNISLVKNGQVILTKRIINQ